MKKWTCLFLTLTLVFLFSLGCASASKGIRMRCPKCGAYFDTREGAQTFEWMRGH